MVRKLPLRIGAGLTLLFVAVAARPGLAQELPVPCGGSACGIDGPATWVTSGEAIGSVSGGTFNVQQLTDNVSLNWASFDIGPGGTVNFEQPDAGSVALNRIFQNDPSRIFGALNANGQVYLLNRNGIIFGESAEINVGGLVATSLDLTPEALAGGIAGASRQRAAAFAAFTDSNGDLLPSGAVRVEKGAVLGAEGGQILLFATEVVNEGSIETPDGQTILAAGERIYLAVSDDPNLRGLLVEVDGAGVVTNGRADAASNAELVGSIAADRGNVSLAAFAVNQLGRVSATTSIRQNGSIRLVARRNTTVLANAQGVELLPSEGGSLTIGENAENEVALELDDPAATVDVNEQPESRIDLDARSIAILENATLRAPSGEITITARSDPQLPPSQFDAQGDGSRIFIAEGATIEVAGANVEKSVADNFVEVELRSNQLRDSPVQRDGPLRGETVTVDVRQRGVRDDGSDWQGTPLADASGEISNIVRTVGERNLEGGNILLASQGDVIVAPGATLDVSGGFIDYAGGNVAASRLLGADGRVYDIAFADRDREYVDTVDSFTVEHPRWGVTEVFPGYRADPDGFFEPGYLEGKDAGSVAIIATRLVLDGNVRADVVRGRYQRLLPTLVPEAELYRPFDQVPLGAALTLGLATAPGDIPDFVLSGLTIADGFILDTLAGPGGEPFDPLADPLPGDFQSRLRPSLLGQGAATRVVATANGEIVVDPEVNLDLPGASSVTLVGNRVFFDGSLASPGGGLSLRAQPTVTANDPLLRTGPAVSINVAGVWVNDNPLLGAAFDPRFIDGGQVSLVADRGDLDVQAGGRIDVSGGAFRAAGGLVEAGRGGAIEMAASARPEGIPVTATLGASIRGFALEEGAALSIAANSVCIAAGDCRDDDGEIWLTPDLYVDQGFADIAVTGNLIGLELVEGTVINARQRNYRFIDDVSLVAGGTALKTFAEIGLRPQIDRKPVDLALRADVTDEPSFGFGDFSGTPGLLLGTGSRIDLDARADVNLSSRGLILADGAINTPGGSIDILGENDLIGVPGAAGGGIWIGDNASLDVSGIALTRTDERGLLRGEILDGGRISIVAERSGLVLGASSRLDVSGTTGAIDLRQGSPVNPVFSREIVGSNGGAISLAAAEYLLVNGDSNARGGDLPGTAGGRLEITIDGNLRGNDPTGGNAEPSLSLDTRRIVVNPTRSPLVIPFGDRVPDSLVGEARVSGAFVRDGGFADLGLNAESLFSLRFGNLFLAAPGNIELRGGLDLELPGRLVMDAANISGGSGDVRLAANTLDLRHDNRFTQVTDETLRGGFGSLSLEARLIDVLGTVRLRGFGDATLTASGDIRLSGVQQSGARVLKGALLTRSDLTLEAAQIYPTTLSDFDIRVETDGGRIDVRRGQVEPGPVFSAGGRLALSASSIVQHGRLRAPYGRIELLGETVALAEGSVTSTSIGVALLPFGELQGGFDWTFGLGDNQTLVFDGDLDSFPQQNVSLDAASIDIAAGATIDISAGGDLLAYEFVPGVGGSTDFLSATENPGLFAILPGVQGFAAPLDPSENPGLLAVGAAVELEGSGPLPAGTYTLLPARYAILPGAVLIRPVDGYTDILPGEVFRGVDGSLIVAGRSAVNGTDQLSSRLQGFALLPRERAFEQADYRLALATEFFDDRAVRTPLDAGTATFAAGEALNLQGDLIAASGEGRGATVAIASDRLRIVSESGGDDGFVEIDAGDLAGLNAESLLLGGRRTATETGEALVVTATEVEFGPGITLESPDIIAVARSSVRVAAGATLAATDEDVVPADLLVDGDAALLRVSGAALAGLVRENVAGVSGDIVIEEGARLSSGGSIAIDASRNATSGGEIDIDGGALRLGASRIILGDAGAEDGLVLTGDDLAQIEASDLLLVSRSLIDVFGSVSLAVSDTLTVEAGGFAAGETDASLDLTAATLRLRGLVGSTTSPVEVAGGTLAASADRVDLQAGRFGLAGFAGYSLDASGSLLFEEAGSLVSDADLRLTAGLFLVGTGADYSLSSTGRVEFLAGDPTGVERSAGIGGRVAVDAGSILLDAGLESESGVLELRAAGAGEALTLGGNARIDLSGTTRDFDGVPLSTPGGLFLASASTGDLRLANGAAIDVSSPDGAGGRVSLLAPSGSLSTGAELFAGSGGMLSIDAESFAALDSLLQAAGTGGFDASLDVRQRGAEALVIDSGRTLAAERIALRNDGGSVIVNGDLSLRGTAPAVQIAARDDVRIRGDIVVDEAAAAGGRALLSTLDGELELLPASVIDLGVAGELLLSVHRDALLSVLDGITATDEVSLAGRIGPEMEVVVEGRRNYVLADGILDAADTAANASNPWYADALEFMAEAGALAQGLGVADDERFAIRPGVVVESAGDLRLVSDFNLFDWRFGGEPGWLTLYAAGDLVFDASLSDGFSSPTDMSLTSTGDSWSYRLVAGRDAGAAGLLDVVADREAGDLVIAPGRPGTTRTPADFTLIRTGNGRIDAAAAGDIRFGNQASVLYTAGIATDGVLLTRRGDLGNRLYPDQGGDIALRAGRDIVGAAGNQLFTSWLWRAGRGPSTNRPLATGWTISFGDFEQNVAALGGGDVSVVAGNDISELSVSIPSIGRQVGGEAVEDNDVEIIAGGNLRVAAGRDILGGSYFAGLGSADIEAGRHVARGPSGFAPIAALGDSSFSITAREDLRLLTALNPTLLPQGIAQQVPSSVRSYFSTYADDASLRLTSIAGDVQVDNVPGEFTSEILNRYTALRFFLPEDLISLIVAPPTVSAAALAGDLRIAGSLTLFPSPVGNLELFADADVVLGSTANDIRLILSDVDPAVLPSTENPADTLDGQPSAQEILTNPFTLLPDYNAPVPVHVDDPDPVRIVARTGDLLMLSPSLANRPILDSAKPARVSAGGSIVNLSLRAQNLAPASVTSLVAGGDIIFPNERTETGALSLSNREIEVAGPGFLRLSAGREIDLQTSLGLSTTGDLLNIALPEGGSAISLIAGIGGEVPDYTAFAREFLEDGDEHDEALGAFLARTTGTLAGSKSEALARFDMLDEALRVLFLEQVLFSELRASGREAAAAGETNGDFTRGFEALTTLFPGANPDATGGETNSYSGDISLFFSRIYTLAGGDISLLAPGGEINAGLATPPDAFGLVKGPSQLGIVAQQDGDIAGLSFGDFAVNESRVFAADGGDILIWATRGDIDAGRGAKTAISAPPPVIRIDPETGSTQLLFPAALTGSGIQTLASSPGAEPGNVDLFAPRGVVNAGDAGIIAGNLTIAATAVLGADNIQVSGISVGVPVDTAIAPGFAGLSNVASGATRSAEESVTASRDGNSGDAPLANEALGWLDVFVEGFGECDPQTGEGCEEQESE